jgi:membrane protease YdiL (CAAX protease family)
LVRIVVPFLFLAVILGLLSRPLQRTLRRGLERRPGLIFIAPAALSAIFLATAAALNAYSAPLVALIGAYTLAPAVYAFLARHSPAPTWPDFVTILWLWLPLEFNTGARWIPKPAQPAMHIAAYGIAITLGLVVFLLSRQLGAMKYNAPRTVGDVWRALAGYAVLAVILIPLGRGIGFLPPAHLPASLSATRFLRDYLIILAGTALPEEILFRAMIQNCLMQKLGANHRTLLLAAIIFGAAHLDNGPQPLPNWRYMILATIAGFVYGKVFDRGSSVFASAFAHALTDATKHWFY